MKTQCYKNVWDALEDSAETALETHLREDLLLAVQDYVTKYGSTPAKAAWQLGISRRCHKELLHGSIDKFSVDILTIMMTKADKAENRCGFPWT